MLPDNNRPTSPSGDNWQPYLSEMGAAANLTDTVAGLTAPRVVPNVLTMDSLTK
jgi:hypothetical protein